MEGDVVDGMHVDHVVLDRVAMALEREVGTVRAVG